MAEVSYPQIPTTVWWGVRQILQRTPKVKLDENMLSASLGVQPAASRQYIAELKKVSLLDDEARATELANLWRMDETYSESVVRIARESYPEGLTAISPPESPDRQKAVNWFMTQGLGEGSAKNKAATYLLITSPLPSAAPSMSTRKESGASSTKPSVVKSTRQNPTAATAQKVGRSARKPMDAGGGDRGGESGYPLNLNVQIHISADASTDQIETIFSAMRKYLRND